MVMPNVARTVGRSKMIKQYHQRCREEEYQPLGRSTLYRILKVLEVSLCKSLQGLDNTAASGVEGFDTLSRIVDELDSMVHAMNGARNLGINSGKQSAT